MLSDIWWPPCGMQRFAATSRRRAASQGALVFAQAVGQRAVELQPVAIGAHAAVAEKVARILMAEEVFAGGHGAGIELRERGLQLEVERIAGFLVPEEVG